MHGVPIRILVAALIATAAAPADAQTAARSVKKFSDLAISSTAMPTGCRVMHRYGMSNTDERGEITCDTKEEFSAGFAVSADFKTDCAATADGKWLCVLSQR